MQILSQMYPWMRRALLNFLIWDPDSGMDTQWIYLGGGLFSPSAGFHYC